jgi:hypothetical protein
MDKWDACLVEKEEHDSIMNMLNGHGMILFFKKGDSVFGAPEESRLVFSKLKSGEEDEDMPPTWKDEAKFTAFDLVQALLGQHIENMFGAKDLDDISIIDQDQAVDEAKKKSKAKKDKPKEKKKK